MTERIAIISSPGEGKGLDELVPSDVLDAARGDIQKAIPALARDQSKVQSIERAIKRVQTKHQLILGDSRGMGSIADESVHLVVTSPPYWTLKKYPDRGGQLGLIYDYEEFLDNLDRVWRHVLRVLVPGGRMVVVVGDVCLPRRQFGRHIVYPLHAGIQEHCRKIGFDNLSPIIWYKISNAQFESKRCTNFLGKPYEPNAIIKNDIEYILFQRKPGGYRQPTSSARLMSLIPESCQRSWFQQIWEITGASTKQHPAPYPVSLAERLIRMFSFVGDTVLDPFMGTGTTNLAAGLWGRNSIGFEIEPSFFDLACSRMRVLEKTQLTLDAIGSVEAKPSCIL
ncbi:DNA-methyltransferase [Methanothrix sp.]